jgi:hypothetical protein
LQQVRSYLGYTGRAADVVARAALDPSSRPRLGIVAAQIVYQVHIADREFRFELDQTQAFLLDLGQGARRAVTHDILETALYVALVRATAWRYLLISGNPEKAKRRRRGSGKPIGSDSSSIW